MKKNKIIPVLLAGGAGTRLWPVSRKSYPKQFSLSFGETSLFQKAALRFKPSPNIVFDKPMTITNSSYRFIVGEQLQNVGIDPGPILIEPVGKNTAPAILACSLYALKKDPDAILLIAPSDHIISDENAFYEAIGKGLSEVEHGKIVTFGIKPNRVETGYGYLKTSRNSEQKPSKVIEFVEKPDFLTAQNMCASENYLWNAGIFMFRAKDIIDAFELHSPNLINPVELSIADGKTDLGFFRLDEGSWDKCKNVSIDYAVMEYAQNLVAVPFSAGWSDLGDWRAVWEELRPDDNGVAISDNALAIECKNVLLFSHNSNQQIVGLGLDDIIAIAMPDAVLVAHKNQAQNVKEVVNALREKNTPQAEIFPKDHRPWGWFESLSLGECFQVKRICVNPGASLSLQSHRYRSEHWVVVNGTAKVTVDDNVRILTEGQSVYVPTGAIHRMENPEKVPMVLIEVQTGTYFGEDDILRYEDRYARIIFD